jgi:hypothetical protein
MKVIMNNSLLVSLFAGVVLLSPCAQAMDGEDAKVAATEEKQEQTDAAKVAELVKEIEPIVRANCNEKIASLERELERLDRYSACGISVKDQRRAVMADLAKLRQFNVTEAVTAMVNEAVEKGPESAAALKMIRLAAYCDEAKTPEFSDSESSNSSGDDSNA